MSGTSRCGWRRAVATLGATLLFFVAARTLSAQVDPRGPVRTIATAHFRVHFAARLDSLGRAAALNAEAAYAQLADALHPPAGPIDLLVSDNVDDSNGYAQVFPTPRVVVYAVPPIASAELRYTGDWLRSVITHELAHVFHLDRARGLWTLGRWIFGRSPVLFPNSYTPSWVKEGLAVYYESRLTGFGRDVSTEFPSMLRAAAADSLLMPLARWSLATTRYPRGNAAYAYGATLMQRAADQAGDGFGMRRYVDGSAIMPVPYLLQTNARRGFGRSFSSVWQATRDSLQHLTIDRTGDRLVWESPDGFYASAPRWQSADTLVWSASTGRDVAGAYVARVPGGTPVRIGWRTSLDINVPQPAAGLLFAQDEWRDPYTVRSDLYAVRDGRTQRLTHGARLTQPDVRRDGEIVAVQLAAGTTSLVQLSADGAMRRTIAAGDGRTMWAEPRWAPGGAYVAAVQLLPTGEQRVVVLDTLGNIWRAVAGTRGVVASPSWTPDGTRLVWASDRSGSMQVETAPVGDPRELDAMLDTMRWNDQQPEVRQITHVSTALYAPSVSPDGRQLAALLQRGDGLHVVVLSVDFARADSLGTMAENRWYTREPLARPPVADSAAIMSAVGKPYRPWRMLVPRYWLPSIGQGRDDRTTYGLSSSGSDILARHTWEASALMEPRRREVDGYATYRYAGLGRSAPDGATFAWPVLDATVSQTWDATFRVVNDSGGTIGLLARRRRFATLASIWTVPHVRWYVSGALGAQYEWRDFTATVDSALGAPGSLLRTGTRYPTVFINTSMSTARRALRGVSAEEGLSLATSTAYRWRIDAPSLGSWRTIVSTRAYVPLDWSGYARHVLAWRGAVGVADTRTATEFAVGGTSGVQQELVPGVTIGDPSRTFAVRGVAPGAQRGIRALAGGLEYRAPLTMFSRVPMPFTLYADRLSVALFSDAGRAWCPAALARTNTVVCEAPGVRDGWMASAGGELVIDLAVAYDEPYRLRLGAAAPYAAPAGVSRRGSVYLTLGGYF